LSKPSALAGKFASKASTKSPPTTHDSQENEQKDAPLRQLSRTNSRQDGIGGMESPRSSDSMQRQLSRTNSNPTGIGGIDKEYRHPTEQ